MKHRAHYAMGADADYIVWESLQPVYSDDGYRIGGVVGYEWIEHTRWLIPGTYLED